MGRHKCARQASSHSHPPTPFGHLCFKFSIIGIPHSTLIHLRYHTLGSSRLLVGKGKTGFIGIAKFCAPMYASRASSSRYFYCLYLSVFSLLIHFKIIYTLVVRYQKHHLACNLLCTYFGVFLPLTLGLLFYSSVFVSQYTSLLETPVRFWVCSPATYTCRTASVRATSEENASPAGRPRAGEVTSSESADVVGVIVNFPWARPYVNCAVR